MTSQYFEYFSSEAKLKVLRGLWLSSYGLGIREIAQWYGLGIRSVQMALSFFVAQNLIMVTRDERWNGRKIYSLNSGHPLYATLDLFMSHTTQLALRQRAKQFSKRARDVLLFNNRFYKLIHTAKKTKNHES